MSYRSSFKTKLDYKNVTSLSQAKDTIKDLNYIIDNMDKYNDNSNIIEYINTLERLKLKINIKIKELSESTSDNIEDLIKLKKLVNCPDVLNKEIDKYQDIYEFCNKFEYTMGLYDKNTIINKDKFNIEFINNIEYLLV